MSSDLQCGVFNFQDGSIYNGEYTLDSSKNPCRHGKGIHTNGPEMYNGTFENDSYHGEGEITFASGASYKGTFVTNQFEGIGKYTWPDGAVYEGGWTKNTMHGQGKYTDKDKNVWEGTFHNGCYNNGHTFITLR